MILFFYAFCFPVSANFFCKVRDFSSGEGSLFQEHVTNYVQDEKGFIWFGTWNGLVRYDGYDFHTFKTMAYTHCILSNSRLSKVKLSSTGNIWCITYDHKLYLFNSSTCTFVDVLLQLKIPKYKKVANLYTLQRGITWVVFTDKSYLRLRDDSYRVNHAFYPRSQANEVYNIVQDASQNEWILTNKGTISPNRHLFFPFAFNHLKQIGSVLYFISSDGSFARMSLKDHILHFIVMPHPIRINQMTKVDNGHIALSTSRGVMIYDLRLGSMKTIHVQTPRQPSDEVTSVFIDSYSEMWAFTKGNGITLVDMDTGICRWLTSSPSQRTSSPSINLCYEDKYHNLIVKPHGGVLAYYDRKERTLKNCDFYDDKGPVSYDPAVVDYAVDRQNNLWLIQAHTISCVSFYPKYFYSINNRKQAETRALFIDPLNRLWVANKDKSIYLMDCNHKQISYLSTSGQLQSGKTAFASSNVYVIYQDKSHRIWIGTKGDGIYLLIPCNAGYSRFTVYHYKHQDHNRFSLNSDNIYSIFQDRSGRIWIGTFGGGINLAREVKNNVFTFLNHNNLFKDYPCNNGLNVRCLSQAKDGTMLIGTTEGLVTFSAKFLSHIRFFENTYGKDPEELKGCDIMQIVQAGDCTYLGVYGSGLSEIKSKNLLSNHIRFYNYPTPQNSSVDLLTTAFYDGHSGIWLVAESSLARFSLFNHRYSIYDAAQFGTHYNFSEATPVIASSGYVTAGTDKGLLSFYPNQIHSNSQSPYVAITGIQYQGENYVRQINDLSELNLTPAQRNVTLYVSALDYANPAKVCYAYKLEGYDRTWNYINKSHSLSYSNLPPGHYTLRLRSCNAEGVWLNNIRSIGIYVVPVFSETVWCKLLYALFILLILTGIIYTIIYMYRLRHQAYLEQEISDVKINLFADVSHELRTPLTLISGPVDEALKDDELTPPTRKGLEIVQRNTLRMSQLINHIFDFHRTQVHNDRLIVEQEDIVSHLRHILKMFGSIADIKQIEFILDTQTEPVYLWVDKGKFEKIIFNVLSEVCKYTSDGGFIDIKVAETNETCQIFVKNKDLKDKVGSFSLLWRNLFVSAYTKLQPLSDKNYTLFKYLIQLHGGTIEMDQTIHGQCCYQLLFKKGNEHLLHAPNVNLIMDKTGNGRSLDFDEDNCSEVEDENQISILVVEDNPDLRAFLISILRTDYKVLKATNGKEGLKIAEDEMPDFIITDITMPEMNGLEMVRHIKSNKLICHIPIIVLSARASLDDRIAGFKNGVDDYITKPFSSSYLKSRIANIINQRSLLQQSYYMQCMSDQLMESNLKVELQFQAPQTVNYDKEFLDKVITFFNAHIEEPELVIDDFASAMNMSRAVFYRKLKSIVGVPPVDFIRQLRIKRAIQLFDAGEKSIAQVAYSSGFSDPKYFSKCFRAEKNQSPSEYVTKKK